MHYYVDVDAVQEMARRSNEYVVGIFIVLMRRKNTLVLLANVAGVAYHTKC